MTGFSRQSPVASQQGYTLIELSIVIAVIGVLLGGAITILGRKIEADKFNLTLARMKQVEYYLDDYVKLAGSLPCPSDATLAESHANFGLAGTYNAVTKVCPDGGADETGTIPLRTADGFLSIPLEMMYDGWGRRFTYRVATGMGNAQDFDDKENRGDLSVVDLDGNEMTDINRMAPDNRGAAYILMSHGNNGIFAWLKTGVRNLPGGAMPTSSIKIEQENADHDNDKRYVQDLQSNVYDDIVRFRLKSELLRPKIIQSPLRITARSCSDARSVVDLGLGTFEAAYPALSEAIIDAARAVDLLCDATPPSDNACAPGLRWLNSSSTPAKIFPDCQCFGDSQTYNTVYNSTDPLGKCAPDYEVDVPANCSAAAFDSGFYAVTGVQVRIIATGDWDYGAGVTGAGGTGAFNGANPVPLSFTASLIYRIGAGSWEFAGTDRTFTPTTSGWIYFAANEDAGTCADNVLTDKLTVKLIVQ